MGGGTLLQTEEAIYFSSGVIYRAEDGGISAPLKAVVDSPFAGKRCIFRLHL